MATLLERTTKNFNRANREAADRYNERADSAATATNLLRPGDVAGDYDAGRLLHTTLGGTLRALTRDDLLKFKASAESLGKAFKGGVTAKTLIDRALDIDRNRANAEIRVALPRQYADGKMHFVTNAGPNSKVTRHHVLVEFMNYASAVSSPIKTQEAARLLYTGQIRVACDCGRWQFWFSYLATIGRFNAGVPQQGFPKIKNPQLHGMACKHILRVAQQLSAPVVRQHIEKMIDSGRKADRSRVVSVSKRDAAAIAELQEKQAGFKRNTIESASEKRLRLSQQRAVKDMADKARQRTAKLKATPERMAQEKRKLEQSARKLASMGGITQRMLEQLLSKLRGK